MRCLPYQVHYLLVYCWWKPVEHAEDAVAFFERCKTGLAPGGILVVKENVCQKGFVVDKVSL